MGSNRELSRLIAEFQGVRASHGADQLARSEEVLGRIAQLGDPASIRELALLLEDDENQDDFMFPVVHVIEAFDDTSYVANLLPLVSALFAKAPRWAKILHMRILNSAETREAYRVQLRSASSDERAAAGMVLQSIVEWRPEFRDRVDTLLAEESD